MEGIGSRLGRVSSRYGAGPAPSAPVFNGPVRKWKRQWVLCQSDNVAGGKGNHQQHHHHQNPPPLLLCRWTPIPSNNFDESSTSPPKRKFRYTPVIALEEKKKEALKKAGDEVEASVTERRNLSFKKPVSNGFMEEIKELCEDHQTYLDRGQLDLQLCLEEQQ